MDNLSLLFENAAVDEKEDDAEERALQWKAVRMPAAMLENLAAGTTGTSSAASSSSFGSTLRDAMRHHMISSVVSVSAVTTARRKEVGNLVLLMDVVLRDRLVDVEHAERRGIERAHEQWYHGMFAHPLYCTRNMVARPAPLRATVDTRAASPRPQRAQSAAALVSTANKRKPMFELGVCKCTDKNMHLHHLVWEREQLLRRQCHRREQEDRNLARIRRQNDQVQSIVKGFREEQIRRAQRGEDIVGGGTDIDSVPVVGPWYRMSSEKQKQNQMRRNSLNPLPMLTPSPARSGISSAGSCDATRRLLRDHEAKALYGHVRPKVKSYNKGRDAMRTERYATTLDKMFTMKGSRALSQTFTTMM
eukprot:PhM_4_TR7758/c0_g1_i1/m.34577